MAILEGLGRFLSRILFGRRLDPSSPSVFHALSLGAILAWVGIGSDALSSSNYGPEAAFLALGDHVYLGVIVALASALTVLIISSSYAQIVEAFPSGGGGYAVAGKLLSPTFGVLSGAALLVDYVLTITISIASGVDALFSLAPPQYQEAKLLCAALGVLLLIWLNLRGVKESVAPIVPVFFAFLATHGLVIVLAVVGQAGKLPNLVTATQGDIASTTAELGTAGMLLLLARAFGFGAGTFTGIEAVSNSLPILRQPRVETAKRTMKYMAISLSVVVLGLMLGYLLFDLREQPGRTLNAVLFDRAFHGWDPQFARPIIVVALVSEAALLVAAAQTGFLGGPKVLANMAVDRYMPTRFAFLGRRLVADQGVLLMGTAALVAVLLTRGSVASLVVLYSISVFITFSLSQLGMMRHWWWARKNLKPWGRFPEWKGKLAINALAFVVCFSILIMVVATKFTEGGWITIALVVALWILALLIHRRYVRDAVAIARIDVQTLAAQTPVFGPPTEASPDPAHPVGVVLVAGFNALGVSAFARIAREHGGRIRQFVFVEVGVVDSGHFKGVEEVGRLEEHVREEVQRFVDLARSRGFSAEGLTYLATDVVEEINRRAPEIVQRYPHTFFFAGELVRVRRDVTSRVLHNNVTRLLEKDFQRRGWRLEVIPIHPYSMAPIGGTALGPGR